MPEAVQLARPDATRDVPLFNSPGRFLSVLIDIPRLTNKVSACLLQLHGERKIREIKTQITVRQKIRLTGSYFRPN